MYFDQKVDRVVMGRSNMVTGRTSRENNEFYSLITRIK